MATPGVGFTPQIHTPSRHFQKLWEPPPARGLSVQRKHMYKLPLRHNSRIEPSQPMPPTTCSTGFGGHCVPLSNAGAALLRIGFDAEEM